jgi:hypothetical protein
VKYSACGVTPAGGSRVKLDSAGGAGLLRQWSPPSLLTSAGFALGSCQSTGTRGARARHQTAFGSLVGDLSVTGFPDGKSPIGDQKAMGHSPDPLQFTVIEGSDKGYPEKGLLLSDLKSDFR